MGGCCSNKHRIEIKIKYLAEFLFYFRSCGNNFSLKINRNDPTQNQKLDSQLLKPRFSYQARLGFFFIMKILSVGEIHLTTP